MAAHARILFAEPTRWFLGTCWAQTHAQHTCSGALVGARGPPQVNQSSEPTHATPLFQDETPNTPADDGAKPNTADGDEPTPGGVKRTVPGLARSTGAQPRREPTRAGSSAVALPATDKLQWGKGLSHFTPCLTRGTGAHAHRSAPVNRPANQWGARRGTMTRDGNEPTIRNYPRPKADTDLIRTRNIRHRAQLSLAGQRRGHYYYYY